MRLSITWLRWVAKRRSLRSPGLTLCTGHAGTACNSATETSCQACQAVPWNQTSSWSRPTSSPSRHRPPRSSSRAATSRSPTTSASMCRRSSPASSGSTARIYLFDVELDHEKQPPPAQELPARRDHRARSRAGGPRRGLRGQLLRRPRVGGLQTREPAAAQQGPPQGALRRQDPGVARRGHRWPSPPPDASAAATPAAPPAERVAVDDHEPGQHRAHQGAPGHSR